MLSPIADETIYAQNIVEKGKRIAEEQESSNSELFSLLTEMRERDEQLKEELRWRYKNQAPKNRTIEENLAALIQQRDKEWREELTRSDQAPRAELKERERASVNDQLMRYQDHGSQGKRDGEKYAPESRGLWISLQRIPKGDQGIHLK